MAVDDELAWEPRLPWIHPTTPVYRRHAISAQPVPERFTIVVPDLLASLTFDPVLGPNPRTRRRMQRPRHTATLLELISAITPLVWAPGLPTGTRRTKREERRSHNQSSVEPAPQGVIAAQRMTWMPALPTRTSRRPLRRTGTGNYFQLDFSVLTIGVTCTELVGEQLTAPHLLIEAVTSPDLLTETLTSPGFINEGFC